jgi:hypothetical protein
MSLALSLVHGGLWGKDDIIFKVIDSFSDSDRLLFKMLSFAALLLLHKFHSHMLILNVLIDLDIVDHYEV